MKNTVATIHGLLFSEGGPIRLARLVELAGISREELTNALAELTAKLEGTGLSVVQSETEAALVIAPLAHTSVKEAQEKELGRDIGDAGLEVLAIILYRGASTRAEIDYIRGVNTASTVRNLMARGLLERTGNPLDGREFLYRPTTELLAHLGAKTGQDLPEYATISSELATFEAKNNQKQHDANTPDTMHDGGSL